ncbi:methionyl-tRNA formyltransferase [Ignatzschineria ureiclastica]|uniref:Methionyl-tRNA formyltransferase n=1 Tax=Ignatzschineria ureiclastica TaxID=472582 RepID=A0A2U2AG94_9GAMM|nr:methionyl-tRNA formyltransferase [Ignatzschineria ureiclastica]PWD81672.1 methionyl-tRNA formyltransferase [Ignatzschineria ureiclastica]GGZ89811.1 methionyl-tRNA formyltransferase [Ignatzschineria ureiclastica]
MSLRIVFAGTPEFSVEVLEALIASEHQVVAVYTQPDRPRGRGKKLQFTPVKEVAVSHNIPVMQPVSLRNMEAQEELKALNADLMVVVAYGLILPQAVLEMPRYGCVNIHASLLPRWRGAAPIHRAIEAGDQESGVAIMQMDQGLDTGAVWREAVVKIDENMTTGELHDELKSVGAKLLVDTIPMIVAGDQHPTAQSEVGITYAEKISKEEAMINWQEDRLTLKRKIHAFNPFPGAYTSLDGALLKIFRVIESDKAISAVPGSLHVIDDRLFVIAGDGLALEILELQAAGKRKMESTLFIKGHELNQKVCQ